MYCIVIKCSNLYFREAVKFKSVQVLYGYVCLKCIFMFHDRGSVIFECFQESLICYVNVLSVCFR